MVTIPPQCCIPLPLLWSALALIGFELLFLYVPQALKDRGIPGFAATTLVGLELDMDAVSNASTVSLSHGAEQRYVRGSGPAAVLLHTSALILPWRATLYSLTSRNK